MRRLALLCVTLVLIAGIAPARAQDGDPNVAPPTPAESAWKPYTSAEHGIAMLLPEGVTPTATEQEGGWTLLSATHGEAEISAVVKAGAFEAPTRIEMLALGLTKVPLGAWRLADEGQDQKGWKWYRTYQASAGDTFVLAVIGHGPKGSYLCLIRTTPADFSARAETYKKWYNALELKK